VRLGHLQKLGFALAATSALMLSCHSVQARNGISLIRDAEIEGTLRDMSAPIFEAAGIAPSSVQIYIVNDDRLNAFVAGGMNLFLNTGLLMRTEHPGQLIGVIAHEVGHIAGGHLSRIGTAQKRATAEMILSSVLGAAAAVAGAPALGGAIISGGQSYAAGEFVRFTRGQEQAADQAALTYLGRSGVSAQGLSEFFRILENQNVLSVSSISPYLRTHPLTRDRITFINHALENEQGRVGELPPGWDIAHARMVVKLEAFLKPPARVLNSHNGDDMLNRYARSIAAFRLPDLGRALEDIDSLIIEYPQDPYFHELKGQMLFENGRIEASVPPYEESVRLRPDAALLRIGLARALIETGSATDNQEAIGHLHEAVHREANNASAWRLLGIAQGREGKEGLSSLSLAEYALLVGNRDDARLYARRAEAKIQPNDPAWLRLQDVLRVIEES